MRTNVLQLVLGLSWFNFGLTQREPFNLHIETYKNTLKVHWNDLTDDDINDVIRDYEILASPVGSKYKTPAYCKLFSMETINKTVESTLTDTNLTVPENTEFDVVVIAKNEDGLNLYSQPSTIGSNFADDYITYSPVNMRNLTLPTNQDPLEYSARLMSAIPCDVDIKNLKIETRKGFVFTIEGNSSFPFNYTIESDFVFDTEHNYEAYLTDLSRQTRKSIFSSPTAFKKSVTVFQTDSRHEQISLKFTRVSGAKKYAILIKEKNCGSTLALPNYGYRGSVDENMFSWKNVKDLPCMMMYQVEVEQSKNSQSIRFEIGKMTNCEVSTKPYCNGPLRPGTTYSIALRIFTETSFYDSNFKDMTTQNYYRIPMIFVLVTFLISAGMILIIYTLMLDNPINFKLSVPRKHEEFYSYYSKKKEYNDVYRQYDNIERIVPNETFEAANQYRHLNRYSNIYPYDRNRVELNPDADHRNTYINASYIEGMYYPREYIAAQGPKPETCLDFWRMVLQLDIDTIVMLTQTVESNKPKCHKYYPENGEDLVISDDMQVFCNSEIIAPNNVYKKKFLEVKKGDSSHEVCHYLFMNWPDHDVPENPNDLIKIVRDVRQDRKKQHVPLLVHCSAGVGRTGTFIALDIIIEILENGDGIINIFEVVSRLREQRVKMVQAQSQYKLLYDCTYQLCCEYRGLPTNFGTRTTRF